MQNALNGQGTEDIIIDYYRPEKIKNYPKQLEFIDASCRFTFVEATTKAGKTSGCLVWEYEQAISQYPWFYPDPTGVGLVYNKSDIFDKSGYNYWWVAPVHSVAKIAFERLKRLIGNKELYRVNESELYVELHNGARIWFKSGDHPDTLYGEDVYGVVIDEASRMKEEAWTAILSTLTATDGLCKVIGNVKGADNWFYEKARKAEHNELTNSQYFKITAKDAVEANILDQRVIDEAKEQLPHPIWLELYFGIPFLNSANLFAYSFDTEKHVKSCIVDLRYIIYLCFDFNINPISCTIVQRINGVIRIPRVIQRANSNIYDLCNEIKAKYPGARFIVNGDATGKNSNAMVRDGLNYFRIIKNELRLGLSSMDQGINNPKIEDNQVLVNAALEHIPHEIDPTNAKALIYDLQHAKIGPDGKLIKSNRKNKAHQLEALDGYRYFINTNCGDLVKGIRY